MTLTVLEVGLHARRPVKWRISEPGVRPQLNLEVARRVQQPPTVLRARTAVLMTLTVLEVGLHARRPAKWRISEPGVRPQLSLEVARRVQQPPTVLRARTAVLSECGAGFTLTCAAATCDK